MHILSFIITIVDSLKYNLAKSFYKLYPVYLNIELVKCIIELRNFCIIIPVYQSR